MLQRRTLQSSRCAQNVPCRVCILSLYLCLRWDDCPRTTMYWSKLNEGAHERLCFSPFGSRKAKTKLPFKRIDLLERRSCASESQNCPSVRETTLWAALLQKWLEPGWHTQINYLHFARLRLVPFDVGLVQGRQLLNYLFETPLHSERPIMYTTSYGCGVLTRASYDLPVRIAAHTTHGNSKETYDFAVVG